MYGHNWHDHEHFVWSYIRNVYLFRNLLILANRTRNSLFLPVNLGNYHESLNCWLSCRSFLLGRQTVKLNESISIFLKQKQHDFILNLYILYLVGLSILHLKNKKLNKLFKDRDSRKYIQLLRIDKILQFLLTIYWWFVLLIL